MRAAAAAAAAIALAGTACGSPTEPGRPGQFSVVFLGAPLDAESFVPRAVDGGRVYGVAAAGERRWGVVWVDGEFARLPEEVPEGCVAEPVAASGGRVVGQVTCTGPDGRPVDAYGWTAGLPDAPRFLAEPYGLRGVAGAATVGTANPRGDFPGRYPFAFRAVGGAVEPLIPPGAEASAAAGIAEDGTVAVTALSECGEAGCLRARAAVLSAGGWRELSLPRGTDRATAVAVSGRGDVLVLASGVVDQASVLRDGRTRALPLVPGTRVILHGINALGQVVGTGARAPSPGRRESEGIVWGGGRQYFLSERLLDEGWEILSADAIDDAGRIAGTGVSASTGRRGAVLLLPDR